MSDLRKELGRISSARFGWGGYQDAMIGLSLTFEGKGWGCGHFEGAWGIDRSEYAKWSEEDRIRQLGETCLLLRDTLKAAKVQDVVSLIGTPIECTFEGNGLQSWRVLEEVL